MLTAEHKCAIIGVPYAVHYKEVINMRKTRIKKHKRYYTIPAYQILAKKTDEEMAILLNMSVRTYKEKIEGYSEFTTSQGRIIAAALGRTQDEIFLT